MQRSNISFKHYLPVLACFATATVYFCSLYATDESASVSSSKQANVLAEIGKIDRVVAKNENSRPVYLHSVVPGGVADVAELKHVVRRDSVVAQHYAAFDLEKGQSKLIQKARSVYVSYRKGDKIYWTKHKVKLVPGETILSDGSLEARARCANRISDTPQFPVELKGPTTEELDTVTEGQGSQERAPVILPVVADNSAVRLFSVAAPMHVGGDYFALNTGTSDVLSNTLSGASSSSYSGRPKPISANQANPIGNQSSYAKPEPIDEAPLVSESSSASSIEEPRPSESSLEIGQGTPSQKPSEPAATTVPSTSGTTEPLVSEGRPSNVPPSVATPPSVVTPPSVENEVPGTELLVEPSLLPNKELTKPVSSDEISPPTQIAPSVTLPQEVEEIPEPSSLFLFGASLAAMLFSRRRKLP